MCAVLSVQAVQNSNCAACICCVHLRRQCRIATAPHSCICHAHLRIFRMAACSEMGECRGGGPPGDAPAARIHALTTLPADGREGKKQIASPRALVSAAKAPLAYPMYTKMWGSVSLMYMVRSVKNLHMNSFAVDRHFCVHAGMAVCQKNGLLAVFVQKRNGINLRRRSLCERK